MKKLLNLIFIFIITTSTVFSQYTLTDSDVVVTNHTLSSCSYTTGGEIIIPTSLDGSEIQNIASNAFDNLNLTKVTLPSSVTSIQQNSFSNNQITEIKITGASDNQSPLGFQISTTFNVGCLSGNNVANVLLTAQTLNGYNFKYAQGSSSSAAVTSFSSTSTSTVVLYPVFTPINYNITYHNVISSHTNQLTYTITNTNRNLSAPASRLGYRFDGWYTESTFQNEITTLNIQGNTGDLDIYAKWTLINYSIGYNFGRTHSNPSSYTVNDGTITLTPATDTDDLFIGWYSDSNFSTQVNTINPNGATNIILYAKWNEKHTITYNLNNGVNSTSNPSSFYTNDALLTLSNPTRAHYTFDGWYGDINFNGSRITTIASGTTSDVQLFAKWTPITYTITYHRNGGTDLNVSGTSTPATYTIETPSFQLDYLDGPVTGSYFIAWYTEPNFINSYTQIPRGTTGNLNLYAKFNYSGVSYTITFVDEGIHSNSYSYYHDDPTIVLSNATKVNYTFDGWYTDASFTNSITSIVSGYNADITIYAKWIANTPSSYTITYNDAYTNTSNPSTYDGTTLITLQDPFRTGYTFLGWYTDPTFTNSITSIAIGTNTNLNLYAKWVTNATPTYTITYNDAYTNTNNPSTYDGTTLITLQDPSRTGYTFSGWYTDPTFTNSITSIAIGTNTNLNLYAKWVTNTNPTYTITYNDAYTNTSNPSTYDGTTLITLQDPSRTGYTFLGWYTNPTFTNSITSIAIGTNVNLNLYAKWVTNTTPTYTITYNDAYTNTSNPSTYDGTTLITLQDPSRTGYTFLGWYTDVAFTNSIASIAIGTNANLNLYAKWDPIIYTITYNDEGDSNSNPTSYTIKDAVITLSTPTRSGYTFNGWYSESSFSNQITEISNGSTGNITLFGKWTKDSINSLENDLKMLTFYPNPTSDQITIDFKFNKIEIYNTSGKIVYSNHNYSKKIDVSTLQQGLYIIRATNAEHNIKSSKLIIE
ncbi:InlB B-repeat-containing protein [Flammeovirga kamogawensis]|uniref:InlB B-repeat-containing protein n=1 Tax=Flammeovirga kamogawensis TaxID=373891 RepID=A0ABX8H2C9_9BACT|nr:InlB B-repeat-containing protein [Flammeovirga kamogawensis]MBB6463636.1 putative repeat protein (TIGR02543 family) [Flammeovirga kamogawensis]QWG09858.1 InlB B-repeat-containing protein [Flammeovirga kamogawensis]TRX65365.1 T9SS type A sorting domain-containing protein [Flammeovirga kamogawensis]